VSECLLTECCCVLSSPLPVQSVENLPTVFGSNNKAQTAAKTVFDLAHRHGNILREGWKNIMDAMLQLFRAELLPKAMVEVRTLIFPLSCQCFVITLQIPELLDRKTSSVLRCHLLATARTALLFVHRWRIS